MHNALTAPLVATLTLLAALATHARTQDAPPSGAPASAAPQEQEAQDAREEEQASQEPPPPADFAAQLAQADVDFGLLAKDNAPMLLQGDCAGATRELLEVVPPEERTAAQAFVLGRLLFPLDFEESYRLHGEAFAKAPEEPTVRQEWALEQHRAGHFAEAEALYSELIALRLGGASDSRNNALRADCLLHLDRPEEACYAWSAVDVVKFHSEVVADAARISAPVSPESRRCALLQRALAPDADPAVFDDLLLLDLHWGKDLETADVNAAYTAHDLLLAQQALGADSMRARMLAFLARWTLPGRRLDFDGDIPKLQPLADNKVAIAADATELRVIGSLSKLPESGRLMNPVFQIVIDNEAASTEELLDWHGLELRRRGKSPQGDVEAMRVLASLYKQNWSDELDDWERMGWTRYGDLDCALGVLARQRDALKPDDLLLTQALAGHPGDLRLVRLAADAVAREGDLLVEPLSRVIMAEYAQMDDCQPVSLNFRKLEEALADRK